MQRGIQTELALQKGPDEAFSVWVHTAVLVMGYLLLTHIFRNSRHKMSLDEIIEGEHWVKVKPLEDEAWLEEELREKS